MKGIPAALSLSGMALVSFMLYIIGIESQAIAHMLGIVGGMGFMHFIAKAKGET